MHGEEDACQLAEILLEFPGCAFLFGGRGVGQDDGVVAFPVLKEDEFAWRGGCEQDASGEEGEEERFHDALTLPCMCGVVIA